MKAPIIKKGFSSQKGDTDHKRFFEYIYQLVEAVHREGAGRNLIETEVISDE